MEVPVGSLKQASGHQTNHGIGRGVAVEPGVRIDDILIYAAHLRVQITEIWRSLQHNAQLP